LYRTVQEEFKKEEEANRALKIENKELKLELGAAQGKLNRAQEELKASRASLTELGSGPGGKAGSTAVAVADEDSATNLRIAQMQKKIELVSPFSLVKKTRMFAFANHRFFFLFFPP
jgi:seryl-tRNA synthetase